MFKTIGIIFLTSQREPEHTNTSVHAYPIIANPLIRIRAPVQLKCNSPMWSQVIERQNAFTQKGCPNALCPADKNIC